MSYDFDTVIDRRATSSEKWTMYEQRGILPFWLADMDFRSPPEVVAALQRRVDHGVFGYTGPPGGLVDAVQSMLEATYGWVTEREWLVWFPSVVTGLNSACRAIGTDRDEVVIAIPVYPPFFSAPRYAGKKLVELPLELSSGRWGFDFDRMAASITPRTRLFLFCHPHNPVGRCFSRNELSTLAQLCLERDVIICSDEIHCGLILDEDKRHIPTATLSPEIAARTITLMSPSKTFNLPGLGCAFAVIPDPELRRSFQGVMHGIVPYVNALAYAAAEAAYREGGVWHAALLTYLRENRAMVTNAVDRMPGLSMTHVEATYLAWIDARSTGTEKPVKLFEDAGVGLGNGKAFGAPGFLRLTFGCPRSLLREGLKRMERALRR